MRRQVERRKKPATAGSSQIGKTTGKAELRRGGIDLPFLTLVFVILSVGLVMLFSASHAFAFENFGDSYYFIKKQIVWAGVGIAVMTLAASLNYKVYKIMALPVLTVSIILLILVLFVGNTVKGGQRWLDLGFTTLQPSEIAKIGVILSFAYMISKFRDKMKTFRYGILPFIVILGIIAVLLVMQPHMSGTILIVLIGCIMMFVGGVRMLYIGLAGGVGAALMTYIIMFTDYASRRISIWMNPYADPRGDGFQTIQSLYAIGSGGLLGLGLGKSRQKYLYIPEPQNDYVFSVVCEELGFVGAIIVMLLFGMLIWRGFVIAFRSTDSFATMTVIGIMSMVGVQTLLNIAVVTNSVPPTGISLPFFSYGGTALVMLMGEMGIVLSISRYSYEEKG